MKSNKQILIDLVDGVKYQIVSLNVAYISFVSAIIFSLSLGVPKKLVRLIKMCLIETYSTVRVGKNLSDMFPIRNRLKQGDALSPLFFNFALEYAIRRVQVNQVEELSDLYSLPNIVREVKSKRTRWAGHVARMGEGRDVNRVLVGRSEGKRPLGRPRRRWEDNITMDLQEVVGGCGDWMELAQDRERWRTLVSTVMNFGVP